MSSKPPQPSARQHPLVIQLRRYAQAFPDFQAELFGAAQKIHQLTTASDASKRELVAAAVELGCNALGDLVDETGLDAGDVRRIWRELIEDRQYEERPIGIKFAVGKAPPKGLFKRGTIAGSDYVPEQYQKPYHNQDADDDDEF